LALIDLIVMGFFRDGKLFYSESHLSLLEIDGAKYIKH
jgi:hypothetical protein